MRERFARALLLGFNCGVLVLAAACHNVAPRLTCTGDECAPPGCPGGQPCPDHANVCKDPSVMALAQDLDHLERHIDWFGSVVPKVPDVWGQARLTKYREEFEKAMSLEQNPFENNLNGALSRADQS
ncbi:MAG: hypothetical protein ACRC7O_04215, partial [Fimbriiglobus sp.]